MSSTAPLDNAGCVLPPDDEDMVAFQDEALGVFIALAGVVWDAALDASMRLCSEHARLPDDDERKASAHRTLLLFQEDVAFLSQFDGVVIGDVVCLNRAERNRMRRLCHVLLSAAEREPTRLAEHFLEAIGPWYEPEE